MSKTTDGEWKLLAAANGPCALMHPTEPGVAIAMFTDALLPANGFVADLEERTANARLCHYSKDLLFVVKAIMDDLPAKRDWLDPAVERMARTLLKELAP